MHSEHNERISPARYASTPTPAGRDEIGAPDCRPRGRAANAGHPAGRGRRSRVSEHVSHCCRELLLAGPTVQRPAVSALQTLRADLDGGDYKSPDTSMCERETYLRLAASAMLAPEATARPSR